MLYKVPTGHQGRDNPALTGARKKIIINKNATSWHKIQRVELAPQLIRLAYTLIIIIRQFIRHQSQCNLPHLAFQLIVMGTFSLLTKVTSK